MTVKDYVPCFFRFYQKKAFKKIWKIHFISLKLLFLFSKYSIFLILILLQVLSFKVKVQKWNNKHDKWCKN